MKCFNLSRTYISELLAGSVILILLAVQLVNASLRLPLVLEQLYGGIEKLPLVTRIGLKAHIWGPIVYGVLLVLMLWLRIRRPEQRWPTFVIVMVASLLAVLVFWTLMLPFARTTFHLGA